MELGKKIIKVRKENNLTQEDFAEKYNVTRQTVSSWENGKSYPDLDTLVKISNDFSISLDVLLKEDKKVLEDILEKQKRIVMLYKKKIKRLVMIIIIIIGLIFGYIFTYNVTKSITKIHIDRILKENNFYEYNEFTYYLDYTNDIRFSVPTEIDINKFLFVIDSKMLGCTINLDDGYTLWIVWDKYNHYGAIVYNQNTHHTKFDMQISNDNIDNRVEYIIDNVDKDPDIIRDAINKGNELFRQLYK